MKTIRRFWLVHCCDPPPDGFLFCKSLTCRQRPYRVECTGSLPNSEVKRRRARLVLGWGTAREDLRVLLAFRFSLLSSAGRHQPNTQRPPGNAQDHPPTTHTHTQTETRTHTHTLLPTLAQELRKCASIKTTSLLVLCCNHTVFAQQSQSYVAAHSSHHRSHFGSRYLTRADAATQAFFAFLLRAFGKQPSRKNTLLFEFICHKMPLGPLDVASGHTASNAPDLFQTPKLSGAGPG